MPMPIVPILFGNARQRRLGQGGINGGLARNLSLSLQYSRRDLARKSQLLSASW